MHQLITSRHLNQLFERHHNNTFVEQRVNHYAKLQTYPRVDYFHNLLVSDGDNRIKFSSNERTRARSSALSLRAACVFLITIFSAVSSRAHLV